MGFDLSAADTRDDPGAPAEDYFHATNQLMSDLRGVLVGAGVTDKRVLAKLVFNEGQTITPRQCRTIAERLTAWLASEDHVAPHWDYEQLRAYERRKAKNRRALPSHITLRDGEREACFYPHPVTQRGLLDTVAELAEFCGRMAERKGIVVS